MTETDQAVLSVFFPNLASLLTNAPNPIEETRAAAMSELEALFREREYLRDLIKQGTEAVQETLYPRPAIGRFLTPIETARSRKRLERWFSEAASPRPSEGIALVAPEVFGLLAQCFEALSWCSGADDFQTGGKAFIGWQKFCRPLLEELRALVKPKERRTDVNVAVTDAIMKAEASLDRALSAWKEVVRAEEQCAATATDLEYQIALRGVGRAMLVVDLLRALIG